MAVGSLLNLARTRVRCGVFRTPVLQGLAKSVPFSPRAHARRSMFNRGRGECTGRRQVDACTLALGLPLPRAKRGVGMLFETSGDLLSDFSTGLSAGKHLVLMPLSRMSVEWSARIYPGPVVFYPLADVNLAPLNVVSNSKASRSLAEVCSAASGVEASTFLDHPVVAFVREFDWEAVETASHSTHCELIRALSHYVDATCLNFVRYKQCPMDLTDCLPGRPGQLSTNRMMSGALLYNHAKGRGRIIGGAAFTHTFTRGLGLDLESIEHELFPRQGDVGKIVGHALMLYRDILEALSQTSRFVQCLSLMEFLADPEEYTQFDEVSRVVARHVATSRRDYFGLLTRFSELTSKKDPDTKRHLGYRTRIVHIGETVEEIVSNSGERRRLFEELERYIKSVIDHMIQHSALAWTEYIELRRSLRPFDVDE